MAIANPVVVFGLNGEPLRVELQNATTIADARACVASALDCCVVNVRLTLKDTDVANEVLADSQNLEELPSKALTAVLVPVILCRALAQHGGRGGCWNEYTCNDCERILLSPDSKCTLISVKNEDSSSSCINTQTVTWDVLLGTYKVKDEVALCSWDMHLHRTVAYGSGLFSDESEESEHWAFSHASSSFKWSRIVLPDSHEERARASLLDRLPADADLLMEVFAEHIEESDVRHCKTWHMSPDDGVPAQLLKDMCAQHRQRMQTSPSNEATVVIANDFLPVAIAKEAVQWWRLDETAETETLAQLHDLPDRDLVGWDSESDCILGICMTVRLADCEARQLHVSNPPSTADGNMDELLELIERGDQAQLPALGQPTMDALHAPSLAGSLPWRCRLPPLVLPTTANPGQLGPVTYTKVNLVAASLPLFCNRSNLNLKVKLISFGNLSMVGDESGVVYMKLHCPTMFHFVQKLNVGASIIIRNATVRMRVGFGQPDAIHVDLDKGVGSLEESRDTFQFEPNQNHKVCEMYTLHVQRAFSPQGKAQGLRYVCIAHSIKPGDAPLILDLCSSDCSPDCFDNRCQRCNCNCNAFCGDAVQVAFDTMSDSEDPVALTLGMTGVIVEICENGDALVRFVGEQTNQLVKRHALPNLVFLEDEWGKRVHPADERTLRDRSTLTDRDIRGLRAHA